MEWLNEPANWQRTGDLVTVSVDTGTDFWRETGYGYVRDSGHVYGEVLAGDLDVSVRVHCTLSVQYDQAGVMLRADERTWLKTGMEFFEGRPRLSTVLTLGRSSWMVTDLPVGTDTIVLRVSRRGDAVEVRYVLGDAQPELAALVFLPPGREVLAGVMGAAPEGPGFTVTFQDLRISESDWSAPADAAMTWQDDQPDWAGSDAPGWSLPEGKPGWAAPEVREEATDWSGEAGDDGSSWPLPAAAEDGPGWAAEEAGEGETDWPAPADVAEEPGWAAPAPDDAGQAPWPDLLPAAEPSPDEPSAHGDVAPGDAGPGPAAPEPAGRVPGAEPAGGEPLASPGPEASNRGRSSAGPAGWPPGGDRAAAADWDLLAAGAQAEPAESWVAQSDADVAHEWPGPPLQREAGTGPSASGVTPWPAVDDSADDAQTDPGLPTARPPGDAATLPDQAEAGTEPDPPAAPGEDADGNSAAGNGTADDGTADDGTGEDGTATDAAANDAAEDGAANDGAAEDGTAKVGAAEDGTAKVGAAEDGAAQAGAAEDGTAKDGAAEDGSAKDGAAKDGAAEDGTAKDGAAKVGAAEDGTAEDSAAEDGPAKDSAGEAGTAEDSAANDSAANDSAAEQRSAKPKLSGRQARRARSKRAAEEPPAEPDAADEWISLLTADPAEE